MRKILGQSRGRRGDGGEPMRCGGGDKSANYKWRRTKRSTCQASKRGTGPTTRRRAAAQQAPRHIFVCVASRTRVRDDHAQAQRGLRVARPAHCACASSTLCAGPGPARRINARGRKRGARRSSGSHRGGHRLIRETHRRI